MAAIDRLKDAVKETPLAYPYIFLKSLVSKPSAQNDEELILRRLLQRYDVPHTFVEFGFSGWEFNCAGLVRHWRGLLVDGNPYNIKIARTILPSKVTAMQLWITLESIEAIEDWVGVADLGILSVDVDGNDYWFLQRLIALRPAIVISEYNSSFGLRPLAVPYDPAFDRLKKHDSHMYYGASLTALAHLTASHGYSLMEIGNSGVNAFFVRNDLLAPEDRPLQPRHAFREKLFADGSRHPAQWNRIRHLPFVDVTTAPVPHAQKSGAAAA